MKKQLRSLVNLVIKRIKSLSPLQRQVGLATLVFILITTPILMIRSSKISSQIQQPAVVDQLNSEAPETTEDSASENKTKGRVLGNLGIALFNKNQEDTAEEGDNSNTDSNQPNNTPTPQSPTTAPQSPTPTPQSPTPTLQPTAPTATPTSVPNSTPTQTPSSTPSPTVTPFDEDDTDLTPTTYAKYNLSPDGSATPNAFGWVEFQVIMNNNGYWDFNTSAEMNMLQPNRRYQLWICNTNCSSTNQARFTTDSTGHASLSNVIINHAQGNDPVSSVKIWQLSDAGEIIDDATTCFMHGNSSIACLKTNIGF